MSDFKPFSDTQNDYIYTFQAKAGSCRKCQSCNGITVSAEQMKNDVYMKSPGFWKQKDDVCRLHPDCHCQRQKFNKQNHEELKNRFSYLPALVSERNFVVVFIMVHAGGGGTARGAARHHMV